MSVFDLVMADLAQLLQPVRTLIDTIERSTGSTGDSWADIVRIFSLFPTVRPPVMTRDQYQSLGKKARSRKRAKTSLATKTKDVPRRIFSLRLAPTEDQRVFFQRAFGIACLAKRLAYKYLGDQREPMTAKRMTDLRTNICTENLQTRVYQDHPEVGSSNGQGEYKVESRPNEFLPVRYRRRLFETRLFEMDRAARAFDQHMQFKGWTTPLWRRPVPSDVRNNAVLQFCRAVAATQAQTEERQMPWDAKMTANQQFLDAQGQATEQEEPECRPRNPASKKRRRSKDTTPGGSKYPPHGPRPEMGQRQVKPPDRNAPIQCFQINARSSNRSNRFSASWKEGDDHVRFMGLKVRLWGFALTPPPRVGAPVVLYARR
jgi:hypothetical protein